MTPSKLHCSRNIELFSGGIVSVLLLLLLAACDAPRGVVTVSARLPQSRTFWDSFNKSLLSGTGIEALDGLVWEDINPSDRWAVAEQIAAGERSRIHAISVLPVLNVDPDLIAYTAQMMKLRLDLASSLDEAVALDRKHDQITSGPVFGVGWVFNLLERSEEKEEGIAWRALGDTVLETAAASQKLDEPGQALQTRIRSVVAALLQLDAQELALRAKLAQRFGSEFPTGDSYEGILNPAKAIEPMSDREIKESLLGKSIGLWNSWTFDSLDEFVAFKVVAVKHRAELIGDYEVHAHLKGASGSERHVKLGLTYARLDGRWKLIRARELRDAL